MKYLELKTFQQASPDSPFLGSGDKIKDNYENNKKNFNLAKMGSHKEVLKEIKDKNKTASADSVSKEKSDDIIMFESQVNKQTASNKIKTFEFLKNRISEISKPNNDRPKTETKTQMNCSFDLELYIGDNPTSKKLLDVNSKYIPFSPSTATSSGYKRKFEELKKGSQSTPSKIEESKDSFEDKKAKKAKLFDDILSIKSNHSKDASDPEKNPHVKAYFDKLVQQEAVDNKLAATKSREVKAVTCPNCNYTSFAQSEYCKKQMHNVKRHMAIQRFFKCKICNNSTYTLDKLCPISSCSQCGNDKFESCGMKIERIDINRGTGEAELNIQSEGFLENY